MPLYKDTHSQSVLYIVFVHIHQGSLKMWMEVLPKAVAHPQPLDISPRLPERYVLRVVVYKVTHVEISGDRSLLGQEMNDLYIKG